jgi:integrase/recombinase XerC
MQPTTPAALPWGDAIARHLGQLRHQRRLAERTLALYSDALARLETLGQAHGLTPAQVRPHHVRGWMARLHTQGLGARSLALTLSAWRGFFRWLAQQGQVTLNPVEGVKAPKASKPLPKALAVDQAVALAAHEPAPPDASASPRQAREAPWLHARDHAMIELLYSSGLRSAELLGLDVRASPTAQGWLDLQAGEAHVLGKGSKRRIVPVGTAAREALQRWLAVRGELGDTDEVALFLSRHGQRLTAAQLRNRLRQLAHDAGLPTHVHPHMLRHSFASHLLQSSGDLRAVQEMLGHANISTTQVYTRLDFQHLAKAYDAAHPRARQRTRAGSAAPPTDPKPDEDGR